MHRVRANRRLTIAATALLVLLAPTAAAALDPALEAKNFAKTDERMTYVTLTPEFQPRLQQAEQRQPRGRGADPRQRSGAQLPGNVCANGGNECAGDVRFYDWEDAGFGIVEPVLFTARNGSTLSGRVWATTDGPASGPAS